jgi:putative ABC transport system ATP-binding protein
VSEATPVVEAEGLELEYADGPRHVRAVAGVDLVVQRGEFVGIVGPSGSGKSSLLFLLAGLRAPDKGTVRLLGRELPRDPDRCAAVRRKHVGFLFQEPFLVPYLTVRENARVGTRTTEADRRIERIAGEIGIAPLLDERPHRLSGGERQRAGILRALVGEPDLVLADEPTASLDQGTGRSVMQALHERAEGAALVVVTHDPAVLVRATRVLRVVDGRLEPA